MMAVSPAFWRKLRTLTTILWMAFLCYGPIGLLIMGRSAVIFPGRGVALAASPNPALRADDPIPVSIQNKRSFADMGIQLQAVVNTLGFHSVNRFCIVGYETRDHDDYPLAYIYWPIQNKLIAWDSGSGLSILAAGEVSDLTRDVLPDGAMTDNYLLQSDVKSIVKDCWKHGSNYFIKKTVGGWVTINQYSQFSSIKAQLQDLADHDGTKKLNKFCAIGQRDGRYLAAHIRWETEDRLFFWLPEKYDAYDKYALMNSVFQIDLRHDLRDEEDGFDQGNEMQRSYAEVVLKARQKSGQEVTVNKS